MEGAVIAVIKEALNEWGVKVIVDILLGLAVLYFARENGKKQGRIDALQETRVAENRELVKVLGANTDALDRLSDIIRARGR